MFFKKAKRVLAGICVFSMMFTTIGENAIVAVAAGNASEVSVVTESNNISTDVSVEVMNTTASSGESDIVPASEDLTAETTETGDGEDIYAEGYTFQASTGTLTFATNVTGIGDKAFKYEKDTWHDNIRVIQFEEGNEETKVIGQYAFANLPNLEKVDLSNCSKLTSVYKYAFSGCTKLSHVEFPVVESLTIENNAFANCKGLTSVTLKTGLVEMGASVFSGCTSLSTVIVEATNINCGTGIFQDCAIKDIQFTNNNTVVPAKLFSNAKFDAEAEIVIPYYIQGIGSEAFSGCKTLTSVTFEDSEEHPSALASIASKAFLNCSALESVTFPSSVKMIEESAYQGCKALTTLVIPNTVTVLGKAAFKECTGVTELSISNAVSSLGESVFEGCIGLTEVVIPSGIGEVSKRMFAGCTALGSISVPNTVESVGESAFEGCVSLPTIALPDTVETVGKSAFKGCIKLNNPVLPKDLTVYADSLFEKCSSLSIISTSEKPGDNKAGLVIPEAVTTIGAKTFADCDSIWNVTISENVTAIGASAFATCEIINTVKFETLNITCGAGIFESCMLVEVIFPEGITEIPAYLFSKGGFRSGTKITIPATVTTIGKYAFGGTSSSATNISFIEFADESQLTTIEENAFSYCNSITGFTIPDTVTTIGKNAFLGCTVLAEITIPENVTSIGASAFQDCTVLTTVHYNAIDVRTENKDIFKNCNIHTIVIGEKVTILPAYLFYGAKFSTNSGNTEADKITLNIPATVDEIGEYAFSNITNLYRVTFETGSALKSVGQYAFNECTALEECKLPDTVTVIGNAAFKGCVALKTVNIPTSLTSLGNLAFYECALITEYEIPAGVTGIGDNTFYGNTALEKITFGGYEITEIGANAFAKSTALTKIDIPSGTTSIGDYAFSQDAALTEVRIPSSVSSIGTDAFKNCTNAIFYVVEGSYAEQWLKDNGFTSQIVCMYTITYVLDGGANDIRNIGGYRDGDTFTFYDAVKPGYSFDGWYLEPAFETEATDLTGRSGAFTLYAKWIEGNYKITYELNGGENDPENPEYYTYYDSFDLKSPTREGYKFVGWYTDSEFKTSIKKITEGSWGDLTLYASWKANTYTVTFNGNSTNATVSKKNATVTFGEVYGDKLATAEREGYLFDGWYTEDGVLITKDTVVSIADRHTLYARWVLDINVKAPVADYASGSELFAGTKIMLSTETPGAYIYYTTDGSAPGMSSTLYSEPIEITENVTIRAIGVKDGYKNSEVSEFVYTVVDEAKYWGDIVEEDRAQFEDASKVPEGIWVAGVEDVVYTGQAIKPVVRVYDNKTLLVEKKDYTIKYSNNKAAATVNDRKAPTITITAKGNYKGKYPVNFNILPMDISGDDFAADDMCAAVNNKIQKPVPVVTWGKTKLKNGKDFEVSYDSAGGYVSAGVYTVTIKGKGNYTGTRTINFELTTLSLMSKVKVSGVKAATYTGKEITQPIVVKSGGVDLKEGTDYSVEYRNHTEVGTATIVLTGMGNYAGTKKVTFKINPVATMNKTQIAFNVSSVTYTGSPIELNEGTNPLKATVAYQGKVLTEGTDYVIDSYSKNTDAGTATVVFRGINSYSGTVKKTFKIVAADVAGMKLNYVDAEGNVISGSASYAYSKGGSKPAVYLEYNGVALKAGTDYTLSYKNNNKAGTATVTVKGKKNFKGSQAGSFTVTKQDISKVSINVPDVPYQNVENIYASKPVLTDLDGKKLASGKDYSATITYTYAVDCVVMQGNKEVKREQGDPIDSKDILPVGTMLKATVKADGNYTGEIEGVYRIVENTIAKAKVTVAPQTYTGNAVQPGKSQITVKVGNTILDSKDYEIVGYSKNIEKGTATITLRGTGNYGGTITAKFKIVQKNFVVETILKMLGL